MTEFKFRITNNYRTDDINTLRIKDVPYRAEVRFRWWSKFDKNFNIKITAWPPCWVRFTTRLLFGARWKRID